MISTPVLACYSLSMAFLSSDRFGYPVCHPVPTCRGCQNPFYQHFKIIIVMLTSVIKPGIVTKTNLEQCFLSKIFLLGLGCLSAGYQQAVLGAFEHMALIRICKMQEALI